MISLSWNEACNNIDDIAFVWYWVILGFTMLSVILVVLLFFFRFLFSLRWQLPIGRLLNAFLLHVTQVTFPYLDKDPSIPPQSMGNCILQYSPTLGSKPLLWPMLGVVSANQIFVIDLTGLSDWTKATELYLLFNQRASLY